MRSGRLRRRLIRSQLKWLPIQWRRNAATRVRELNENLRNLSARILAVQNVFTDRRAYVNASTYAIETETSIQ